MGMVPKMRKFELVGVFDAGMYDYNTTFVYIALPDAQKFFDMPGKVSGVQVRIDEIYNADRDFRSDSAKPSDTLTIPAAG